MATTAVLLAPILARTPMSLPNRPVIWLILEATLVAVCAARTEAQATPVAAVAPNVAAPARIIGAISVMKYLISSEMRNLTIDWIVSAMAGAAASQPAISAAITPAP